jgi:hypothetical protein
MELPNCVPQDVYQPDEAEYEPPTPSDGEDYKENFERK